MPALTRSQAKRVADLGPGAKAVDNAASRTGRIGRNRRNLPIDALDDTAASRPPPRSRPNKMPTWAWNTAVAVLVFVLVLVANLASVAFGPRVAPGAAPLGEAAQRIKSNAMRLANVSEAAFDAHAMHVEASLVRSGAAGFSLAPPPPPIAKALALPAAEFRVHIPTLAKSVRATGPDVDVDSKAVAIYAPRHARTAPTNDRPLPDLGQFLLAAGLVPNTEHRLAFKAIKSTALMAWSRNGGSRHAAKAEVNIDVDVDVKALAAIIAAAWLAANAWAVSVRSRSRSPRAALEAAHAVSAALMVVENAKPATPKTGPVAYRKPRLNLGDFLIIARATAEVTWAAASKGQHLLQNERHTVQGLWRWLWTIANESHHPRNLGSATDILRTSLLPSMKDLYVSQHKESIRASIIAELKAWGMPAEWIKGIIRSRALAKRHSFAAATPAARQRNDRGPETDNFDVHKQSRVMERANATDIARRLREERAPNGLVQKARDLSSVLEDMAAGLLLEEAINNRRPNVARDARAAYKVALPRIRGATRGLKLALTLGTTDALSHAMQSALTVMLETSDLHLPHGARAAMRAAA
jgi:hypothetical protein